MKYLIRAPFGIARMRVPVRVDFRLDIKVGAVQKIEVQRVGRGKAEKLEVVPLPQTLKLSPQPHSSLTFGLLNLKPSFKPSRAKSSWVPSR
ncbi:hypothetical protein D3C83_62730 [compost metagenome]